MRAVLRAAEGPYALAVGWRNRRFDRGHAIVHRVSVPVISIGNLTLGGTGKTPLVKWAARWLAERGARPAIVSRGYGAAVNGRNDEALELSQALPDVPHLQNPDRVLAAERAIAEFRSDAIVLDDGFQHRRLARDLDVVLLDALEPFGFEHVFPRGTLREPLEGLRRADVVSLSRADAISAEERGVIRRRVADLVPQAAWCELSHAPGHLLNADGATQPLFKLAGRRVAAFCGIGNPAGFRHTLGAIDCEVVAWREFPDHHAYRPGDLAALGKLVAESNAEVAVCTHKDLVKVRQKLLGDLELWSVAIEMQFLAGREALESLLSSASSRSGSA